MEAPLPGHVGVAEVIRGVGNALRRAFPTSFWVKGEVSDYRPATQGHHYFNLVERLQDGSQAVLPCAVWKSNWPQVCQKLLNGGIALTSGQEMLFQGTVKLYDAAGKLTFHVSDVYPESRWPIEAQRRAVLARLHREKLIGLNRRVEMPRSDCVWPSSAAGTLPAYGTSRKSCRTAVTPSRCCVAKCRCRGRWWSGRFAGRWKSWR